ncbi:MAG: RNA-binding protein [Thermoplasmata archaeon]
MAYRNRHRLKEKKVEEYSQELEEKLGDTPFKEKKGVDVATTDLGNVLLVDTKVVASFFDDQVFPTIDGLLEMEANKRYVTVDMGAVKFVYNGADIMSPGIVEADETIEKGDMVWVRDVEHHKPLAVGKALIDGGEMVEGERGKAVKSLHHIGDKLYSV